MSKALEKALAIITALGGSDETISELKKNDDAIAETISVDDVSQEIIGTQKEIVLSDETNFEEAKVKWRAELLGARTNNLIKQFGEYGLTKEMVEALPEKDRYDAAVKLAKKLVDEKKSGNGDEAKKIAELHEQLEERENRIKQLEEEEIPKVRNEATEKLREKELTQKLRSTFDSLAIGEDKKPRLVADGDILYTGTLAELNKKYDIKYNEDGSIAVLEKGKTTLAYKNSKAITLSQAFDEINSEKGNYKKSEPFEKKKIEEHDEPARKFKVEGADKFKDEIKKREAQGSQQ